MIQPFCSSEKINGNKTNLTSLWNCHAFCSSEKINGNKTLLQSELAEIVVLF